MLIALVVIVLVGTGALLLGRSNKPSATQARKQTTTTLTTAPSTKTVSLPIEECPSTYGTGSSPPTRYPATMSLSLPLSVVPKVGLYSDSTRSVQPILAPASWSCSVSVGADGSTVISVFPPGQADPLSGTVKTTSAPANARFVTAYSPSACQGCIASLVCSLFPQAAQQLGYSGQTCASTPPQEQDTFSGGSEADGFGTVGFTDPAGIKGTGTGSGGTYAAIGTLRFGITNGSDVAQAVTLTCVLPPSDSGVCNAANLVFITQDWGLLSAPTGPPPTTTTTEAAPIAIAARWRPSAVDQRLSG